MFNLSHPDVLLLGQGKHFSPTRSLLIAETSLIYALYVYKFGLLSWLRLCWWNAGLPSRQYCSQDLHKFLSLFLFLTFFFFYFLMFLSTSLINSFLLQPPPKTACPNFFLPTGPSFAVSLCQFSISDSIADVLVALHGISATVAWALLALHDCTHQRSPTFPFNYLWSLAIEHITLPQLPVKSSHSSLHYL